MHWSSTVARASAHALLSEGALGRRSYVAPRRFVAMAADDYPPDAAGAARLVGDGVGARCVERDCPHDLKQDGRCPPGTVVSQRRAPRGGRVEVPLEVPAAR